MSDVLATNLMLTKRLSCCFCFPNILYFQDENELGS